MKMTNVAALNYVLEHSDTLPTEVVERVVAMKATFEKRADSAKNRERKPSAKEMAHSAEMEELRAKVVALLAAEPNRLFACKELAEMVGVTVPKMSATLTALRKADRVMRTEDAKGKNIRWQAVKGE